PTAIPTPTRTATIVAATPTAAPTQPPAPTSTRTITVTPTRSPTATATPAPDLTVSKSHSGNFHKGDLGDTYSIVVSNSGAGQSFGSVTVVDSVPPGLLAIALSGQGWSCTTSSHTCNRADSLAAGASYPPITLTVNVASNAVSTINIVTVSGGGDRNA